VASLLDYANHFIDGEIEMVFTAEVPYVQLATGNIVHSSTAKVWDPNLMETCRDVGNQERHVGSAVNNFVVGGAALTALGYKWNAKIGDFDVPQRFIDKSKLYIVSQPKHGVVYQTDSDKTNFLVSYKADAEYVGQDSFTIGFDTFARSGKPVTIKVKFNLAVVEDVGANPQKCESMTFSSLSTSNPYFSRLLSVQFKHLIDNSVSENTGTATTAQIMLDPNAARPRLVQRQSFKVE
jgi:hypothetical protein